eukprot:Sspe_Gene.104325::Locus_80397_Transcript_1_1_Confidence_1.000_Length_1227::g.104325::m.104325
MGCVECKSKPPPAAQTTTKPPSHMLTSGTVRSAGALSSNTAQTRDLRKRLLAHRKASATSDSSGEGCPEMKDIPQIDASFFNAVRYHENRDFVVLLDKSASMAKYDKPSTKRSKLSTRWQNAREAIKTIVNSAQDITLYMFDSHVQRFDTVNTPEKVLDVFNHNHPGGSTNLSGALRAAFKQHFCKDTPRPTTILVITDGEPNNYGKTIKAIESAASKLDKQEDLSVTFIQIGDDPTASQFLKKLDDELDCKYDIVDTLKDDCLQNGLTFEELIFLSVTD